MKTMLFAQLAVLATGVLAAQQNRQTLSTAPAVDQQAAQAALRDSVIIRGNREFPAVAALMGTSTQSVCAPYETRTQHDVAHIKAELAKNTNKGKTEMSQAVYSPPLPIWVISSYARTFVNDIGPTSWTLDAVPGNYTLLTSSQFQNEFNSMKNYVGSLNILDKVKADLNAKIEQVVKNYATYASSISISNGSLIHKASVSGAGVGNGRTAYEAFYDTTEICLPPEITNLAALDTVLKAMVKNVQVKAVNLTSAPRLQDGRLLSAQ